MHHILQTKLKIATLRCQIIGDVKKKKKKKKRKNGRRGVIYWFIQFVIFNPWKVPWKWMIHEIHKEKAIATVDSYSNWNPTIPCKSYPKWSKILLNNFLVRWIHDYNSLLLFSAWLYMGRIKCTRGEIINIS